MSSVEQMLTDGLTEQALALAQAQVSAQPDDPEAHSAYARALYYSGQMTAAVAAAERATRLAPKDATLWARLGGLYAASTRPEEARSACEKALSLDSQHPSALLNLAQALLTLERRPEALSALQRLAQLPTLESTVRDTALRVVALVSDGNEQSALVQQLKSHSGVGAGVTNGTGQETTATASSGQALATVLRRSSLSSHESAVQRFGRDLTALAARGQLDSVTGRDSEIDSMLLVLSRKKKANPCLVGEPGVGKTACVEGLAQRVVSKDVPAALRGTRVVELSLAALYAGCSLRGELESRVQALLAELRDDRATLIFIDEIHTLTGQGQGGQGGELPLAEMLKPALARGELSLIGATTPDGYERSILRDPALARRFERISVVEPTGELLAKILHSNGKELSAHHHVQVVESMIDEVIRECARWLPERAMPDVGVDVLDRSLAMAAHEKEPTLTQRHLRSAIASMGLASTEQLYASVQDTRTALQKQLLSKLWGQDEALSQLIDSYALGALRQHAQPRSVLWFHGPTSVGKHSAIALLSQATERPIIRWNLGVLTERHDSTRLLGAPAGYTGYDDGSTLTRALRATPNAILCLDAPEHAHPEVQAIVAKAMVEGAFVDARGWRAELRRACVILVSDVETSVERSIGYSTHARKSASTQAEKLLEPSLAAALDDAVFFAPLSRDSLTQIAKATLERALVQLQHDGLRVQCELDAAANCLVSDKEHSARAVIKKFEQTFLRPLLKSATTMRKADGPIVVRVLDNMLRFD